MDFLWDHASEVRGLASHLLSNTFPCSQDALLKTVFTVSFFLLTVTRSSLLEGVSSSAEHPTTRAQPSFPSILSVLSFL